MQRQGQQQHQQKRQGIGNAQQTGTKIPPKHTENDRIDEAGPVNEEKTIRDQFSSDQIFGRSIIVLKMGAR